MNRANYDEQSTSNHDPELIHALAGMNAEADMRVAQKTRRVVHGALLGIKDRKVTSRRSLGIAMMASMAILLLLSPAIWNAFEDLVEGEHFGDIPTQMALLLIVSSLALLAALVLIWKNAQEMKRSKRQF